MSKKFHKILDTSNDEYLSIYHSEDNQKVVIHVGYYEVELNNKQVDELILALKAAKKRAG